MELKMQNLIERIMKNPSACVSSTVDGKDETNNNNNNSKLLYRLQ